MSRLSFLKSLNRNTILIAIAIIGILITGGLIYANQNPGQFPFLQLGMSDDAIAKKALDYLNKEVLAGQSPASLVSVSTESGLIKIKIKIDANEYDSYVTKDGKLLFPQVFNMSPATDQAGQNNGNNTASAQTCESLPKSDKPALEAFVVSRCPYGLQMQRMMAEAIKNSPDLAQYVKVRYIGAVSSDGKTITSMHGDAEAQENLRQICIRDEQASKYWSYASCQMKSGDTAGCEKSTGVDSAKLASCISDPSRGVAFAKVDFDLATKNNASGSPTLVLGETTVQEFDASGKPTFGGRSADEMKQLLCCASGEKLGFCSKTFTTAEAATSFSATYESSDSSASSGTNCAPAQ